MQQTDRCVEVVLDVILAILTLAATIAAGVSALQAKRAVQETHKSMQTQSVASLLDAYASQEMLDALLKLRCWEEGKGARFAEEFRRRRTEEYESVKELDQARRRVSHHFQKIYILYSSGLLDENMVRLVAVKQQVLFYRQVVEPLEEAIGRGHDSSSFDALGELYDITRRPDQMSNAWPVQ